MSRRAASSRLGAWCCLLGSTLALVAFFLPSYGPVSLWVVLLSQRVEALTAFLVVTVSLVSLLLLLLSGAVVACWGVFFRSLRWNSMPSHQGLTVMALVCYLLIAIFGLILTWEAAVASSHPLVDLLVLLSVGVWLMPVGLILALIGDHLLVLGKSKAGG